MRGARLVSALLLVPAAACLSWQEKPLEPPASDVARFTSVGEAELHYTLSGPEDGAGVVMVHGFGSDLGVWDHLAAELGGSHRVLRLDLRGFGWSSRYAGDYGREVLATDVFEVMDAVGLRSASVVAHSMGTAVAVTMAARAPHRIDAMVLVAPWLYEDQVPWGLRDARTPGVGELIFGVWFDEQLDWKLGRSFEDPDAWVSESMVEGLRAKLQRPGTRAASLAVIRGLDLPGLEPSIGRVRAPTRVVACEADTIARIAYAERLASQVPDAELSVLAGCGHFPMIERSAAFVGVVRDALPSSRP